MGGMIIGGVISGIVIQNMSSRMWIDIYTQINAYKLNQATKALEELQKDNKEDAIGVLEDLIEHDVGHTVDELDISESTKKKYKEAIARAKEYKKQYTKQE